MKKTWECSQVKIFHSIQTVEEYERTLDEWAEVIYLYLCQFRKDQAEVPNFNAPDEQKRTAANG